MSELIKIQDNYNEYDRILALLLSKGHIQESRNGRTLEIEDLVIEVADPTIASFNGVRKFYGPDIGLVEGLQLIAGISDSALTAQIQPNFRNFMEDDTGKFWGAYGPRVKEQLPIIVERLRQDPDTRQAVITLWDPKYDAMGGKKDHPCTSLFNFRIRDGKLNMTTFMRSNDAIWGWPFDLIQFSMLMQSIAWVLKVEVGTYTHHAGSFHIYEPHWDIAKEITKSYDKGILYPIPYFMSEDMTMEGVQDRAFQTYRVVTQTLPWNTLEFFDEKHLARRLIEKRVAQLRKFEDTIE